MGNPELKDIRPDDIMILMLVLTKANLESKVCLTENIVPVSYTHLTLPTNIAV